MQNQNRARALRTAQRVGAFAAAQRSAAPRAPQAPLQLSRSERTLGFAAYWGYYAALGITAVLLVVLAVVESEAVWLAWLKMGVGALLAAEGFVLAKDWRRARQIVHARQRRRGVASGARQSVPGPISRRLASLGLQLVGVAWIGLGTLAAALGLEQLL